jgi:plasmid stabilization system protein ParE
MKSVKYHPLAESELVGSAAFYERRREFLGDGFLDLVNEALTKIRSNPEMGKPGRFQTRSLKVRRYPFRIIYLIQVDRIWIVAVAHLSRRPGYWSDRVD